MTESSLYGGDAPYVKLFRPLIVAYAHLHSHTDYLVLRAEYFIMAISQNTAI